MATGGISALQLWNSGIDVFARDSGKCYKLNRIVPVAEESLWCVEYGNTVQSAPVGSYHRVFPSPFRSVTRHPVIPAGEAIVRIEGFRKQVVWRPQETRTVM